MTLKNTPIITLFLGMFLISPAKALILEDLISEGILEETLSHKKVAFYQGSFDPLHLGHEDVATLPIEKGLCDYVLIYPAWGGDDQYKNRTDIKIRQGMIFTAFAHHPKVIVTRLSPQDLQQHLTTPLDGLSTEDMPLDPITPGMEGKPLVKIALPGLKFIGVIGSDTALSFHNNPKADRVLLTGIQIPEIFYNHSVGGLMALPGESFIVAIRKDDNISHLENKINNRPIIEFIKSEKSEGLSSTGVKKALHEGKSIDSMVSNGVAKIIKEKGLYKG